MLPLSIPSDEAGGLLLASYVMLAFGALAFLTLAFVPAPYGRYSTGAHWLYGPLLPARAAWLLQELPSFAVPAALWWGAATGTRIPGFGALPPGAPDVRSLNPNTVLLAMLLLHYFNRTFVYPLRLAGGKPTPLLVFLLALVFCAYNGALQGRWLTAHAVYPAGYLTSPRFLMGAALWAAGLAANWHADATLRALRRPGETGYKIPRGGLFELVSAANLTGEILEWAGWALAANSLPAMAFAVFTFANIAPRGAQHHKWYLATFRDYPKSRRAVIPWVW